MRGEFVHATAFFCLYADSYIDDDSQPDENATAEITNASDNDNAMASRPANAATVQSDTNDNAKSLLDADYFKGKSIDEIKRVFSAASLKQLKGFALCYTIPYFNRMNKSKLIDALASKISLILEERYGYMTAENVTGDNGYAQQDDIIIPVPKPRTIPQPVSVKFIPGTVYYGNDSGNHYPVKIIARTADAVTTDFIGAWIKEAKIQTIAGVEYAAFMTQYRNIEIWADKQEPSGKPQSEDTAQPEITAHAEIAQPEALYMDDSYSDAPGDNSCPDMDIPDDHNPLHIVQTWYGHSRSDAEMLRIDRKYEATHYKGYSIFAQFIPSVPVRFCLAKSESHALALAREYCNAFCVPCKCTDARVEKLCDYFPDWTDFLPRYMDDSLSARVFRDFHYDPIHFFRDKGIHERKNDNPHDNPGFTVVPSEHITRPDYTAYPDTIIDECPYVTVSACDKPENTPRRNPITEAKFKWVNQFLLAVFFLCKFIIPVMYAKKYNIRDDLSSDFTKFTFNTGLKYSVSLHDKIQFISINDRRKDKFGFSWLDFSDEDNISYSARVKLRDDGYTELLDFKEFDRPCYAFEGVKPVKESNRVKYVKFEVGKSYSAVSERWGHHERHITVIDRFAAVPSDRPDATHKTIYIKVRMSGHAIKADYVEGWISCYVNKDNHTEEYSSLPELIFRADNPDAVKEIPAEINDITPETKAQPKIRKHNPAPASDIEHKLIETKDLHFSEQRAALDHNAAVISSCMFHEAIVSMLLKISPAAICQLGMHMGLFIAKPKGKKIVIAEAFAKRLIERRELHAVKSASVHTHTAQHTSINTAGVPDNVKFFETKHGQLTFIEPKDRQLYFVFTD
ncbi:MAG: hypothetical protein II877_01295, partial [Synergistaceae bacterium]|nr:hypothetical protein [Synergistaceae bacterium]